MGGSESWTLAQEESVCMTSVEGRRVCGQGLTHRPGVSLIGQRNSSFLDLNSYYP